MDKVQVVLIAVAGISYVASLVFAYLNQALQGTLYFSSNGQIDNKYYQHVSPKGVAFAIVWPIIYLWNLAGLGYIAVSLFLPESKSPVKLRPTLISKKYLLGFSLTFATTVGWLFAFDREILELSLALLILASIFIYITVGVAHKVVYDNASKLEKDNKVVLILMRVLIHNGLCTLATWLTVATLINTADVMIYFDSFGQDVPSQRGVISVQNGSTVALALLMALIVAWFVLDNFVWEKYFRFTYTVYPVLILAMSALVDKLRFPWVPIPGNQNLIIAAVNLAVATLALVAKIMLSVWRWRKRGSPVFCV